MLNSNFFLSVKKKDSIIIISGISASRFLEMIRFVTVSNRVTNNIIVKNGLRSVSFEEFFLIEIEYIISKGISYEPSLLYKRTLTNILDKLIKNTWLGSSEEVPSKDLNYARLKDFYYTPLDYQSEFFKYYDTTINRYRLKGTLLAAAAGTGKTYMSLCLSSLLESDRVVIISPKNAVERVWEKELTGLYRNPPSYYLSSSNIRFTNQYAAVYHYEALNIAISDIEVLNRDAPKITVIIDESHNFGNIKSGRSELLLTLLNDLNTVDIIFMSGTPVKALGSDVSVIFKGIDPTFNDNAAKVFNRLYTRSASNPALSILNHRLGTSQFEVPKNRLKLTAPTIVNVDVTVSNGDDFTLETVGKKIKDFVEARTKYYKSTEKSNKKIFEEILSKAKKDSDDPAFIDSIDSYVRDVTRLRGYHDDGTLMQYIDLISSINSFEKERLLPTLTPSDKKLFRSVNSLMKYPSLKIRGEALGRVFTAERVNCFKAIVKALDIDKIIEESEKKVVIFSSFVDVCQEITDKMVKSKHKPNTVYGKYTSKLNSEVNKFNSDKNYNPMIATFDSLSTAVPLVVANTIIFIDFPYRDHIRTQAIARVHRLGATTDTFIIQVSLDTGDKPNLSTRTMDILKWSQQQVKSITGQEGYSLEAYTEDCVEHLPEPTNNIGLSGW